MTYSPFRALGRLAGSVYRRNHISRQDLLVGAAEGIVGATVLASGIYGATRIFGETNAEKALRQFPDRIHGAVRVDKYPVEGARHCLVHIKTFHHSTKGQKDKIRKSFEELRNRGIDTEFDVEKYLELADEYAYLAYENIGKIIDHLRRTIPIEEIYIEGVSVEGEQEIDKLSKMAAELWEREKEVAAFGEDEESKKVSRIIYYSLLKETCYGRLKVRGTETRRIMEETDSIMKPEYVDKLISGEADRKKDEKMLTEDREDAALEIVSQNGADIAVLPYGGVHSWQDTIKRWNSSNPSRMFCLIEVLPQSSAGIIDQLSEFMKED